MGFIKEILTCIINKHKAANIYQGDVIKRYF